MDRLDFWINGKFSIIFHYFITSIIFSVSVMRHFQYARLDVYIPPCRILFCNTPRDSGPLTVPAVLVLHESLPPLLFSQEFNRRLCLVRAPVWLCGRAVVLRLLCFKVSCFLGWSAEVFVCRADHFRSHAWMPPSTARRTGHI